MLYYILHVIYIICKIHIILYIIHNTFILYIYIGSTVHLKKLTNIPQIVFKLGFKLR